MARRKSSVRPARRGARKSVRRVSPPSPALSREEASFLFDRLEAEERSEKLWSEMTAASHEDGDRWLAVEDHLLAKSSAREENLRRWKFFGK